MTSTTRNQATKRNTGGQASGVLPAANVSSPSVDAENPLTAKMLAEALKNQQESICRTIAKDINILKMDIKSDLDGVKSELATSVASLQASLTSQERCISELENAANFTGNTITELSAIVPQLRKEIKELQAKKEDLESRSRSNNLRLVGIPEMAEQGRPVAKFVSELLRDLLDLDEPPLLDRAHRSLRERQTSGEPPRVFIMSVHYTHARDEILRKASQKQLTYGGRRVFVFPDYTSVVSKKSTAFGKVKKSLRAIEGARYGLRFPAILRFTLPGKRERQFEDSELAMDYINHALKDSSVTENSEQLVVNLQHK